MLQETEQNTGIAMAGRKATGSRSRATKVTVELGSGRSVVVAAPQLTLDSFIEQLEEVLAKARTARKLRIGLTTFIAMLRDQAATGGR